MLYPVKGTPIADRLETIGLQRPPNRDVPEHDVGNVNQGTPEKEVDTESWIFQAELASPGFVDEPPVAFRRWLVKQHQAHGCRQPGEHVWVDPTLQHPDQ